jgi:hypothetical protein
MTVWTIMQIILNLVFVAGGLLMWARLSRPAKDDPRMSKGLQLLQSKIAILEDLSDRTETQVKQLTLLLEQKGREVQDSIQAAQEQIHRVDNSIQKSLDVSKIFQDKIPHKEIIERQNTVKYIQAARLAHQGMTSDDISQRIDIPKSELDFIVKVNRNKLMFSEEHLPDWAQESLATEPEQKNNQYRDLSQVFESFQTPTINTDNIKKLEDEFRAAIVQSMPTPAPVAPTPTLTPSFEIASPTFADSIAANASPSYLAQMANQIKNSVKEKIQNIGEEIFAAELEMNHPMAPMTAAPVAKAPEAPSETQFIKQGEKEFLVRPFKFKKIQKDEDADIEEFMKI